MSVGSLMMTRIARPAQAVIHCEIVRQAARVIAMDRERLRCAACSYLIKMLAYNCNAHESAPERWRLSRRCHMKG